MPASEINEKIISALERIAQVIRVQMWEQGKIYGLSPIQIQFITYFTSHRIEECTVTDLSRHFQLTKATISDAVSTLQAKGLLIRQPSAVDGRVTQLLLTDKGKAQAEQLSTWTEPFQQALANFLPDEKEIQFDFLLQLIDLLEKAGVMSRSRICLNCNYFRSNSTGDPHNPHYCQFLQRPLSIAGLRVDCPDYTFAEEETE